MSSGLIGTSVPTPSVPARFTAVGGVLRGALWAFAFGRSGLTTAEAKLNHGGIAGAGIAWIPVGHLFALTYVQWHSISNQTGTVACRLFVGTTVIGPTDVTNTALGSASFSLAGTTDAIQVAPVVAAGYTVDATSATNGMLLGVTPSVTAGVVHGCIYGYLYKP